MSINFEPTEDEGLILETVGSFSDAELRATMREHEDTGGVSAKVRKSFSEIGLDRLLFPDTLGGMGGGDRVAALVTERLARGDAGASVALQSWDSIAMTLQELGSEQQTTDVLGLAQAGNWGSIAWTEGSPGDDPSTWTTQAVRTAEGYTVTGEKRFVRLAEGSALTIVFAQTDLAEGLAGVRGFALVGTPEGMTVEAETTGTGLLAAPSYRVRLESVVVPESGLLQASDDYPMGLRRLFARLALMNAARCVGVMESAWTYARDYAAEREAFGKPIAHFQAIAFMLSDMATLTDASRWSVWQAADSLDRGAKTALRDAACAVSNAFENANRLTEDAVQILGGAGFVMDHPCERWMRDARSLSLSYGSFDLAIRCVGHELMRSTATAELDDLLPLSTLQPVLT